MSLNKIFGVMSRTWQTTPKAPQIVGVCQKLIAGEFGVVEASHAMCSLVDELWPAHGDKWIHEDFDVFYSAHTASRDLPVGEVRKLWSPDALRIKDEQLADIEARFRERALDVARRLVQSYKL